MSRSATSSCPTEADGAVRVYYSRRNAGRFVSAVDVLDGKVDPARLAQKLVLIGVTGLGLLEYQNTPVGERMPGSEIHAQLLENLYDGTLLRRPDWAPWLETALFLLLGGWLVVRHAALEAAQRGAAAGGRRRAARGDRLRRLPDAANAVRRRHARRRPHAAVRRAARADAHRGDTAEEGARARRAGRSASRAARIAGELEAARRIQTATLPRADLLAGDARIDIAATMIPARETGGDLYDYFRLDERRLFFLAGDVAGKGLSASIFMAVSKALYKSATLRAPNGDIGELMSAANAEVSRDNPGNALRHRVRRDSRSRDRAAPVLQRRAREPVPDPRGRRDRSPHRGRRRPAALRDGRLRLSRRAVAMRPGELLCAVTDGVTEAAQSARARCTAARASQALLPGWAAASASARDVVEALRADVEAFVAGAEPSDDLTILALRWHGPGSAG